MAAPTSLLQFQTPAESINYVLNPSAESPANFSATANATVTRSTTYSRQITAEELYSFNVTTSGNAAGLVLTTATLPSATTYVSCWVRGTFSNLQFKIGSTTVTPTLYETDGAWSWYVNEAASFTGVQVSGQTAVTIQFDNGANCYVDHVLLQQGGWTTAFHGSFPGCRWNGIAHESTSTLLATVDGKPNLAAGTLNDIGNTTTLIVSSVMGFGAPDLTPVTIQTADRGGVFQKADLNSRVMVMAMELWPGSTLLSLHSQRATLLDLVQPGQPFVLRYRGNTTYRGGTMDVMSVACSYTKGLEGSIQWITQTERVPLTLTAYDPWYLPQTETATALTLGTSIAAMGYCLKRGRGVWARPAAGTAPPGTVYDIIVSSRGHVFAACAGAVYGWDGSAWASVGAVTGGSAFAYCLAFDPSETILYVGGSGTSFGGTAANYIAKYTLPATGVSGGTWAALGTGLNAACRAIVVIPTTSGHTVYAFGEFTTAGGSSANYMATWNGSAWASVSPNTLNGAVWAAQKDAANNIYFAGACTNIATVTASAPTPTATCYSNGGSLDGGGPSDGVDEYRAYHYYRICGVYAGETAVGSSSSGVGASFYTVSSVGVGLSWTAMAGVYGYAIYYDTQTDYSPPPSAPTARAASNYGYLAFTTGTTYYDDGSVAADYSRTPPGSNGTGGKRVGYLNTTTGAISAVTGRLVDSGAGTNAGVVGTVYALALADDNATLYAGGAVTAADAETCNKVAVWNGGAWLPMAEGLTGGDARAICILPSGEVAVGGAHTAAGPSKLGSAGAYLAYFTPGDNGAGVWTHGGVVLPSSTVYTVALDHNGDVWLGSDSNGAATVGALTSVTSAGGAGALLTYPRIYAKGPGSLRYVENEVTGHRIYLNTWVATGELVVLDLRRGFKTIVNTRGEPKTFGVLGGDLGSLGLRNGANRLVALMTSTDGNSLMRLADSGALLSADG